MEILHKYQLEGVQWLLKQYELKLPSILADGMGMGKTIQSLMFISEVKIIFNVKGPFLIVCPLSVINGWIKQLQEFCNNLLTFIVYIGTKEERQELRNDICGGILNQPIERQRDPDLPFDLILTTYEMINSDFFFLGKFRWRILVVDEAHRLKGGSDTKLFNIMKNEYHFKYKLLLTGTPLQNSTNDVLSLFSFLDIDTEVSNLKLNLNRFMLRREDTTDFQLPEKEEYDIWIPLTKQQKKIYLNLLKKNNIGEGKITGLQNLLVQLRKCCNHPYLFFGVEPEPFQVGDHLWEASSKTILLVKLLIFLKKKKSKILLFTGSTSTLDIIQDILDYQQFTYQRLDGSIRSADRNEAINRFTNDENIFIFLLSTRAGGVGLNLTQADCVIFYDSDYNPQMDRQALARAYRQGQTKAVKIFRFLCKETLEEVIYKRAQKKESLFDTLIGEEDNDNLKNMALWGVSDWIDGVEKDENEEMLKMDIEEVIASSRIAENGGESDKIYSFEGKDYTDEVKKARRAEEYNF
eukprot:GHVL01042872.1.p2 GENE.GHVL01042872.1~~GHVL01042872.1.p2  ORF type:complete len:522 (-),score=121.96 GHVL01042872.1:3114-4679(-)